MRAREGYRAESASRNKICCEDKYKRANSLSTLLKTDLGSVGVVLSVGGGDDGDDRRRDVHASTSHGRVGDIGSEDDGLAADEELTMSKRKRAVK